ncbi:MAG: YeeE/YedE family protein [Bacteroidetes bacterium]|jgi:uncharacterized membrane protein YedE/YeeE|nr:YeeE/YedE family protein [Bacteroidota bacterium]
MSQQPPSTLSRDAGTSTATLGDQRDTRLTGLLTYLLIGTYFGIVLVQSEVVSWFRIQEMFRFQSFHMYGIIGSAIVVAALSVALIKRFDIRDIHGEPISIKEKEWVRGYSQLIGGTIFGLGWALLGACPGPLYALIGSGVTVMVVALLSAIGGAWAYGHLRPKLPH